MRRWSDINGIYQIYPRSFKDANGDGIGDLAGITERLSYLKGSADSLGVDAIWLSPFYTSPMRDFGYDVSNYTDVDPIFGSLDDFDALIARANELDIAVMIDLVPNHTSSDHPWFQEALQSPDSPKRDYYIFKPAQPDGSPPNNWKSVFGGSAWEPVSVPGNDSSVHECYCHSFLPEQPDLNWANPAVQEEMKNVVRFWFDRGIDGIRVDAVRWMGKDKQFRDDPVNSYFQGEGDPYHSVRHEFSRYSPDLEQYLRCITEVAHEYEDGIIIFEDHLDDLTPERDQIRRMHSIDPTVAGPFNFQGMHIPFGSQEFGRMVTNYQENLPDGARSYYCFSNHDESRLVTRFGYEQARMLAVLQLTLPGIPVIYYGQEIGMRDGQIPNDRIQDPFELRVPGRGLGRDPERTPMQWNSTHNAGFSAAERTWLPVNSSYIKANVATESSKPSSFLRLYQQLLKMRDDHPLLRSQSYATLHIDDSLFVFERQDETEQFVVMLNFSDEPRTYGVESSLVCILSAHGNPLESYSHEGGEIIVKPLDGVVLHRTK